jgi:hypothetical protein
MERPKELIAVGQLLLGAQSRMDAVERGLGQVRLKLENVRNFKAALNEVEIFLFIYF